MLWRVQNSLYVKSNIGPLVRWNSFKDYIQWSIHCDIYSLWLVETWTISALCEPWDYPAVCFLIVLYLAWGMFLFYMCCSTLSKNLRELLESLSSLSSTSHLSVVSIINSSHLSPYSPNTNPPQVSEPMESFWNHTSWSINRKHSLWSKLEKPQGLV